MVGARVQPGLVAGYEGFVHSQMAPDAPTLLGWRASSRCSRTVLQLASVLRATAKQPTPATPSNCVLTVEGGRVTAVKSC